MPAESQNILKVFVIQLDLRLPFLALHTRGVRRIFKVLRPLPPIIPRIYTGEVCYTAIVLMRNSTLLNFAICGWLGARVTTLLQSWNNALIN